MTLKEIIKKWEGNKKYSLKILELMPEDLYEKELSPEVRTFKAQAKH